MAALTVTTIQLRNVDLEGNFYIEIIDHGMEASLELRVLRADDDTEVVSISYMLPDGARALAAQLLKTADAVEPEVDDEEAA